MHVCISVHVFLIKSNESDLQLQKANEDPRISILDTVSNPEETFNFSGINHALGWGSVAAYAKHSPHPPWNYYQYNAHSPTTPPGITINANDEAGIPISTEELEYTNTYANSFWAELWEENKIALQRGAGAGLLCLKETREYFTALVWIGIRWFCSG